MAEQAGPDFQSLKGLLSGIDPAVLHNLMPPTGGLITMMFTDIVDSTRVKKLVGDARYHEGWSAHNNVVRECLKRGNGHELKTIGDAFFVAFTDPRDTVNCAIEIQQRLKETPISIDAETLSVRIGAHTGMPKVYHDPVSGRVDLFGTDVDKAARVESLAGGGQVLVSEETKTRQARRLARLGSLGDEGTRPSAGLRNPLAGQVGANADWQDVA